MSFSIERETRETQIKVKLEKRNGRSKIDLPCGFISHMLDLFAFHAGILLSIEGKGDIHIDYHHLVEDLGIVIGQSFLELSRSECNSRYGWSVIPMDGSLVMTSMDISGRGKLVWKVSFPTERCGDFDLDLVQEFWESFTREAKITLHVNEIHSDNSHHLAEAIFKSIGQSIRQAISPSEIVQSTKGLI